MARVHCSILFRTRGIVIASSLRELFAVVLFFAVGLVALRTGGALAGTMLFAVGVLLMAMAIVAFVAVDVPKAYAIGFLLPVTIYAVCIAVAGTNELDPYDGKLPTTFILRYAHQHLVTKTYVDPFTGKAVPNYDPAAQAPSSMMSGSMMSGGMGTGGMMSGGMGTGGMMSGGMGTGGMMSGGMGMGGMMPGPSLVEVPDRPTFMLLAHTLTAIILGWFGAKFATRVYRLQHRP